MDTITEISVGKDANGGAAQPGIRFVLLSPIHHEDLRKFNQKSCTVSNARVSGKTAKGTIMVEVACADGYKGYMIEYNTAPTITAVGATGCAFAGGCKLPGNV